MTGVSLIPFGAGSVAASPSPAPERSVAPGPARTTEERARVNVRPRGAEAGSMIPDGDAARRPPIPAGAGPPEADGEQRPTPGCTGHHHRRTAPPSAHINGSPGPDGRRTASSPRPPRPRGAAPRGRPGRWDRTGPPPASGRAPVHRGPRWLVGRSTGLLGWSGARSEARAVHARTRPPARSGRSTLACLDRPPPAPTRISGLRSPRHLEGRPEGDPGAPRGAPTQSFEGHGCARERRSLLTMRSGSGRLT